MAEVVPSNVHAQVAIVPPATVELSVNVTHKGSHPDKLLAVKFTTGKGSTVTVTVAVTGGEHPSSAVTV